MTQIDSPIESLSFKNPFNSVRPSSEGAQSNDSQGSIVKQSISRKHSTFFD